MKDDNRISASLPFIAAFTDNDCKREEHSFSICVYSDASGTAFQCTRLYIETAL